MNNREEVNISEYGGYSETQGVIGCPNCGKDIWCDIPVEGQEINCQNDKCDWEGIFIKD